MYPATARADRIAAARNRGRHTQAEWFQLAAEMGWRCVCCGEQPARLTKDHIIPVSRGGSDAIGNIQPLCQSCNSIKGTTDTNWLALRRLQDVGGVA
jgi:5-methylcytosine-specific restriction endonuclease McrA